jgi:FKBP-type peptidyl-prolyl cis-trans isomerase 2
MSRVKDKNTVKVHYTGKLTETGQIFDSSLEREPLEFTLGEGMLIQGFEEGVIDMEVNEKKTINIPKEKAYGEKREELFHKVSKEQLPEEIKPEVGMGLISRNPDGSEQQLRIAAVNNDHIIVDANHPLAGQDLTFEVEVLEIS